VQQTTPLFDLLVGDQQQAQGHVNVERDLHAVNESIVLLPVRWETHATPETGGRSQGAIN
jgi:hypothetical protein